MANSKRNNGAKRHIDWPAIKADYLKGRLVRDIARLYGVSASAIYRRAKRNEWSKDRSAGRPTHAAAPLSNEASALPAIELAQLRALAAKLRDRLDHLIDGRQSHGGEVMGSRESPAALLLKLCQITEKITSMASRMAGADGPMAARLSEQDHEILERFKNRHGLSG